MSRLSEHSNLPPDRMTAHAGETVGLVRKMPSRWWIQVCPECSGQIIGPSQTHNETCPYRHGTVLFVPLNVEVRPVSKTLTEEDWYAE